VKLKLSLLFLFAMLASDTTHAQQKSVLSEPIESLSKSSVDDRRGTLVFEDRFERDESQETNDEPGNGWKTNSKARAAGNKQVDLVDGAMRIYRHEVADHGVSVVHDAGFQNGSVEIKFLLEDEKDSLGLNFADLKFKEVHAGHLFKVIIGTKHVEIADLKTGGMDLKTRELRQAKKLTKEQTADLKTKSKRFPNKLKTGQWYSAVVKIAGETLSVSIDGVPVGSFLSEGIAHPTKRTLRLAIAKKVVVDDLMIFSRSDEGVPSSPALKVLLVAGGCCHDYGTQTQILKDGIESRIHAEVTVIYNEATGTDAKFEIYESDDWAKGYDVILHDECCANVTEEPYVQRILAAHKSGIPAVNLHCAMHSYRWGDFRTAVEPGSPNSGWYEMIGIQSSGHGPKAPIDVSYVESKSPITGGMSAWKTIDEELYNNVRMFSGVQVLATGKQTQMPNKKKLKNNPDAKPTVSEAVVIWTNEFGPNKTKIFSTSLGHFNDTVKDERYMELVVRGLLWTTGNLTADGKPTKGFAIKK
jgi:type 1 glutamine amidotransferase